MSRAKNFLSEFGGGGHGGGGGGHGGMGGGHGWGGGHGGHHGDHGFDYDLRGGGYGWWGPWCDPYEYPYCHPVQPLVTAYDRFASPTYLNSAYY